ncbi:glutamate/gamma-aminobutyrate family transporter YjeM [Clostridium luticellarii]|uniref:Inner membrane transporter YjeM n=1 Tax=Clostridium luticellarii TaxID=1691940 RepID=A0A2T0BMD1_9CLOT|nr:glutamate/gamma-aminobutyrate family transporter YjeM [Clostridium luticellarii]MCI1945204.1 glutamate/gamma-aminobutyrate family transporter YjeM [Clostridium luticellarii]MCI1968834.1 glutamate/gamma-aminobutyrate family transporter YjeM [Clostridium luticellarii]MCI1995620.1 glutamate/gamma-aminobutyrate family transporter YjeM [Clostridium luticellarii]MCI2040008.1 glutamate/gamma-aminobutyrate family transporter YjeM [Clostridium luticellarii]PRR85013.1 Inner membrane transporter YjeM 
MASSDVNVNSQKKMKMMALILMIFTSVFGFANMPRSFYLMGYGAIPWYILSGLTFFIPYAFMMAEYGAAFKNERGGIYSWMEKSVGPKYAFVGTFMWFASYIIWMVNICSTIWIPFSNAIFGKDVTSTWGIFGLNSTQTIGILGIIWIIAVTFTASKGLEKITKVTSIGGTAVVLLNIVLLVGALIVLAANGGHLAEAVTSTQSFIKSPNPGYQSSIGMLSFLVFAIFAYGGIEVTGGLVDQTERAEVTFPKGVTIAALIITVGYSLGIFLCGIFTNWNDVLSTKGVHMANAAYVVMQNLGYQLGQSFNMDQAASLVMGAWVARFVGLSMFLALTGAFFTLCYSPLKQIIEGTPRELWPGKMSEIKDGMPINAMWIQCIVVVLFVALVSFGGDAAAQFFSRIVLMTNVAMTLPYIFLSGAFIAFKKKKEIEKPFEIYKSKASTWIATIVVTFTVGFANFFTIIQPAVDGDLQDTIWMIVGPLFFAAVALLMYARYDRTK